jgi:hypothetical protein
MAESSLDFRDPEKLEKIKAALRKRAPVCFLCKWTLQDLEANGKLTDWPPVTTGPGGGQFPWKGKLAHLWLEFATPKTGSGIIAK